MTYPNKSLFFIIVSGIIFVGLALQGVLPEHQTFTAVLGCVVTILISFIKTFYPSGLLRKGLTPLLWAVTIVSFALQAFTISTDYIHYSPEVVLYVTTSVQALIIYLGNAKLWQE